MESFRSRPTPVAADDEENGRLRRLPDPRPPPPHRHGDANALQVDAALVTRRDELLWELHKERIRQDMILRELLETERAMSFTAGGHNPVPALPWSQDYWHCRTPSVPPWEAPLRQPCPCCCGSSTAVRAPPVYPHVERSPSPAPLLQLQSASDTEKQQDCRSSGARTHPTSSPVELCSSPSKCALEEETLVPVAPNAPVRSIHQRTDDSWEHKGGAEACHGVQHMYESRNQKSEEREATKFAKDDQSVEAMQLPYRYRYSLGGNENAGSYQQKRPEFSEPAPEQTRLGNDAEQHQEGRSSGLRSHPFSGYVELCPSPSKQTPVAAKAGINEMLSTSFCEEAASGHQQAVVGVKVDVEDGRSMQPLHEIKNQSCEEGKAIEFAIKDGKKKPCNSVFSTSPQIRITQQTVSRRVQSSMSCIHLNSRVLEWIEVETGYECIQGLSKFPETHASPTPEGTSAGLKRKLTAPSSPVKKQKPLGQWSGITVCQANPMSQQQLEEHLAGKRHRSNVAALQTSRSKSNSPEPNMKATPARSRTIATNVHQGGKEEVPENGWTCTLCQAKCTREWDYYAHLGGRRHQENEEARRVKLRRSYCVLCDVQCSSEKTLESHLGGRRHREKLERRD